MSLIDYFRKPRLEPNADHVVITPVSTKLTSLDHALIHGRLGLDLVGDADLVFGELFYGINAHDSGFSIPKRSTFLTSRAPSLSIVLMSLGDKYALTHPGGNRFSFGSKDFDSYFNSNALEILIYSRRNTIMAHVSMDRHHTGSYSADSISSVLNKIKLR